MISSLYSLFPYPLNEIRAQARSLNFFFDHVIDDRDVHNVNYDSLVSTPYDIDTTPS